MTDYHNWTGRLPWERQKGETSKAFEAFTHYRDLGNKRSIRRVADLLVKSNTLISRWSAKYDWVERIVEYENWLDAEARLESEELVKNAKKREVLAGTLMMNKLIQRLNDLQPEEIPVGVISQLAKAGSELNRNGLDIYTSSSRTEITGPDGQVLPQLPAFEVVFRDPDAKLPDTQE